MKSKRGNSRVKVLRTPKFLRFMIKRLFLKLSKKYFSEGLEALKFTKPPMDDGKTVSFVRVVDTSGWDGAFAEGDGEVMTELSRELKRLGLWYDFAASDKMVIERS